MTSVYVLPAWSGAFSNNSTADPPGWMLYLDGKPVEALPVSAKAGQRITLDDGVT